MDFLSGLPVSQGKSVIMVVVDRLTKVAHFSALGHPYTAEQVANAFIHDVVRFQKIHYQWQYSLVSFGRNYSN